VFHEDLIEPISLCRANEHFKHFGSSQLLRQQIYLYKSSVLRVRNDPLVSRDTASHQAESGSPRHSPKQHQPCVLTRQPSQDPTSALANARTNGSHATYVASLKGGGPVCRTSCTTGFLLILAHRNSDGPGGAAHPAKHNV